MTVEYTSEHTEGSRRHWHRTAEVNGEYSHTEKWCVECECWRKVKWIGGERFCEICDALDEYRSHFFAIPGEFDEYEQAWEDAFPPSLTYYPVKCRCGMGWDSVSPLITRCADCERLASETEENMGRL